MTVKPQHEKKAALALEQRSVPCFLPLYRAKRRWSDRVKEVELPLFPGYVFAQFRFDRRLPVLKVPGVASIVTFGEQSAPVPDTEIDAVRKMIEAGRLIQPWPFLTAGKRVRVEGGSLDGVEGILLEIKNSLRVVVSIPMLQRSVAVELDRDMVTPLPDPPARKG